MSTRGICPPKRVPILNCPVYSRAKLSKGYFEQLQKHPAPVEEAAIRAINNNPATLDYCLWLAYRLHVLSAPKIVTWRALKWRSGIAYL
ncbi:replication protein RepA [Acidisphaera sp. S103]|uniref:replication protein RepA n=1 Tax=Acidisphaera sp. S103 TaxID=1747223 RepID=UPI00131D3B40|nr:replication protein RepA [Acidisphaera sp. S103]